MAFREYFETISYTQGVPNWPVEKYQFENPI